MYTSLTAVHVQAPAGAYRSSSWPEQGPEGAQALLHDTLTEASQDGKAAAQAQQQPWRARVPGLLAAVDQGLLQAVRDTLLLCGGQVCPPGEATSSDWST